MVACWLGAVLLCLPGLIGAYNPTLVNKTAIHMYQFGWVITFAAAFILSLGVNYFFPPRVVPEGFENEIVKYEGLVETEGYLPGDVVMGLSVNEDEERAAEKESIKNEVGYSISSK